MFTWKTGKEIQLDIEKKKIKVRKLIAKIAKTVKIKIEKGKNRENLGYDEVNKIQNICDKLKLHYTDTCELKEEFNRAIDSCCGWKRG